ncbi:MAG: RAMP superfamily CRISPR-associated protein, partial [Pseudomonadota bacterium]|nr:RAMP superfamily CRISPR-associated protein [Pseudomonadota bacterium]
SLAATPELIQKSVLTAHHLETPTATEMIELNLTPLAEGFRFGGLNKAWDARNHEADAVSLIEKQVTWPPENQRGDAKIQDRALLFPASSFKGALSHRVAYHYNLLTETFADDAQTIEEECAENTAVRELFGYVADKEAHAGCVLFNDFYLTDNLSAVKLPHSGIDRFTGGVREGVLFFEELITCEQSLPPITLVLTKPKSEFKPETITALERTLDDLCHGYLALGAGSGRGGYGYFTGTWNWLAKPREEKQNAA